MNFKEVLLRRFETESEKLQLLKSVDLLFSSVKIKCNDMFVTDQSSLGKKGYQNIPLYQGLQDISGPVIYFYTFSNCTEQLIRDSFQNFKECKQRNCSALPKRYSIKPTNTLYVGSDRNSIARRTMEHMGYAHAHTGGLQISKWGPAISLQLELNYASVKYEYLPVLRRIETALARHLDPSIGRHEKG